MYTLVDHSSFSESFKNSLKELKISPDVKNLVLVALYAASINDKLTLLDNTVREHFNELYKTHSVNAFTETRRIVEDIFHPEDYAIVDAKHPRFDDIQKSDFSKTVCNLKSNKAAYESFNINSGFYLSAQQFRIDSAQEAKVLNSMIADKSIKNIFRNNPKTGLGIKYRDKSNRNALFYPDFIAIKNDEIVLIEPKSIKIDDNFEAKYRETLDWIEDNRNEKYKISSIWYVIVKNSIYKIDIENEKSMLGAMRSEDAWHEGKIGEKVIL